MVAVADGDTLEPGTTLEAGERLVFRADRILQLELGSAGAVAYSTAKAGLHGFTQSVAADYATQNIRANCIIVGSVHTPMVAHLGAEARERRKNMVPMQTEGTAWDIAYGAVYLASDESRWVTGVLLPIDGGLVALRAWPR